MQLSRRIALNGVQLDELDERILISEVYEMPPDKSAQAASIYDGTLDSMGSMISAVQRNSKRVRCKFRINYKRPYMEARGKLLDRINGWALAGGVLTIGSRPEQKMTVRCQQELEIGDMRDWTREYTLIFEANAKPYWENTEADTAKTRTTSDGNTVIEVTGGLPNVLDLEISNQSGKQIDKITVSEGGYRFEFRELGMQANEVLVADHDSENRLRIRLKSAAGVYRSAMISRTIKSDDELRVKPGSVTVNITADRAVIMTVKCRGRSA